MARRVIAGIMLASVTGLAAAGCGGSDNKDNKPGPEVAWAGKVCDAVGQGSGRLQLPTFPNPNDVKAVKAGYLTFLGSLSSQLKTLESSLQQAGAPPVDGGQTTLTQAMTNLRTAQTALAGATDDVRKAKATNTKAFQTSVAKLSATMAKYSSYEGPVKDLRANPKLRAAFDKSPSCTSRKL